MKEVKSLSFQVGPLLAPVNENQLLTDFPPCAGYLARGWSRCNSCGRIMLEGYKGPREQPWLDPLLTDVSLLYAGAVVSGTTLPEHGPHVLAPVRSLRYPHRRRSWWSRRHHGYATDSWCHLNAYAYQGASQTWPSWGRADNSAASLFRLGGRRVTGLVSMLTFGLSVVCVLLVCWKAWHGACRVWCLFSCRNTNCHQWCLFWDWKKKKNSAVDDWFCGNTSMSWFWSRNTSCRWCSISKRNKSLCR